MPCSHIRSLFGDCDRICKIGVKMYVLCNYLWKYNSVNNGDFGDFHSFWPFVFRKYTRTVSGLDAKTFRALINPVFGIGGKPFSEICYFLATVIAPPGRGRMGGSPGGVAAGHHVQFSGTGCLAEVAPPSIVRAE